MTTSKAIVTAAGLLGAAVIGTGGFLAQHKNSPVFFPRTLFQGKDISGRTPEEVADAIYDARNRMRITLREDGKVSAAGTAEDFGYSLDRDILLASLTEAQEAQRTSAVSALRSLYADTNVEADEAWSLDEETLFEKIRSQNLQVKRTPSRDAQLVFNEETGAYKVQPEVYGNQFKPADLQEWVERQLKGFFSGGAAGSTQFRMDVPADLYRQPAVTAEDPKLTRECEALNRYAQTSVTYSFGKQKETLGFDTFREWLTYSNGSVQMDSLAVEAFVEDLADRYDTYGIERDFTTSLGEEVHFYAGQVEYGYTIDREEELAQLKKDLRSRKAVTREPIYYETNRWGDPCHYSRDGEDDLAGTYVEVSISDQYVWFYKNGKLIAEGECVTGNHSRDMDTTPGMYAIAYKQSPAVLKGGEGSGHYETPVTYWMPFNGGQGLHDATWRGEFGGSIYRSHGSHGCVNLPYSLAETIYKSCKAGMAVIVY